MQFRHTIALAVMAIFMAVSCITVDKHMGENLVPDDQDLTVKSAEFEIPVQLKSSQPVQTLSGTQSSFGAIRTKDFGLAEFATVADLYPSGYWDLGKDIVVKSVYFEASVSKTVVAQDQQDAIPQQVFVHRTFKNVDSTTLFNNSFGPQDYDPSPLNVGEVLYFGGDSIKVYLNKEFGEELLTATEEEIDSVELYANRFKGLLIRTNAPEEGTYGGRQNFLEFGYGAVYITVNFQPTWEEGLDRKDTLFVVNYGENFCLNLSSYESNSMQTKTPGETLGFEGAAGLKPYIDKDSLKKAIDAWKTAEGLNGKEIIISKGSLILPFETPEDYDMTKYPPVIYPCNREFDTTYNANLFFPVEDINGEGYSIGNINRALEEYRMDIPSFIQDFVSMDASELDDLKHNIWIMSTASEVNSYYGTTTYKIDEGIYYVGKLNGPDAKRAPKLQIIYSVLK